MIEQVFELLDRWRHLPAYRLEPRIDVFLGLYLRDVLTARIGSELLEIVSEVKSTDDLRHLVGHWVGRGVADFPTIERVDYSEELRIDWDAGREVLVYEQLAVLADGSPSHRESGFLEVLDSGEVQLWNVQNNGRSEVLRGSASWDALENELTLELRSVAFANDERMLESRRLWRADAHRLHYEMRMMTTTTDRPEVLQHLQCDLERRPEAPRTARATGEEA